MIGEKKQQSERKIRSINEFAEAQKKMKGSSTSASSGFTKSSEADQYARMLMTGYNIFRPLLVAAIFAKSSQPNDDVLFEMGGDKTAKLDAIQDVINRVSIHWTRTQDLVNHIYKDFKSAGVTLGDSNNRWLLRLLLRNTADLVATAAMNGSDYSFDQVKEACSAVLVMLTGKPVPGLTDADITSKLQQSPIEQMMKDAFAGSDLSYSTDDTSAIQMASFNSAMRLTEVVNSFDFFQGHSNPNERLAIVAKLNEIAIESGFKMYQVAVGVDKNGEYNEAYTRQINDDTQRQLLMRCISDSATFVEKSYEHYASKARRSILSADDKGERYNLKIKVLRQGVPYEQIAYDVKMARRSLNDTARHSVAYLSRMLEAPAQPSNQASQESTQAKEQVGEKKPMTAQDAQPNSTPERNP